MPGPPPSTPARRLRSLARGSYAEYRRIAEILRRETVGGALLLGATIVALLWANSPWSSSYFTFRDVRIGYAPWHFHLTLGEWAADGLLAIFFFVAGLELKREFVAGDLRRPATAIVPVVAACGGVAVPAIVFTLVNLGAGGDALRGWAVPTATDIAFALAVLAVISSHLPAALRTFLLTLAVVDDLLAIGIIAVFYTDGLNLEFLGLALFPLAVFTWLVQRRVRAWYLLLPLAIATWALVHASGIHATVAGVLLGFAVPVLRSTTHGGPEAGPEAGPGLAEHFERRFRPLSAGVAVPVFAFLSAGVAVGGLEGLRGALADSVAIGIVAGLVLGKTIGIFGATWLVTKTRHADLDPDVAWIDVFGLALLAGVGFTVSLLVAELGFGAGSPHDEHATVAVLAGSLTAAILATIVLRVRNRHYRRVAVEESIDRDGDGVPDVFGHETS